MTAAEVPDSPVQQAPPPAWLLQHVINPLFRLAIPTPLGRRIPLALLKVTGRRSGRTYSIPVAVHQVLGSTVVLANAPWVANFRGGAEAELVRRGRTEPVRGELVEDPARIGAFMRAVLDGGRPARGLGLSMPNGYRPSDDEAASVRKAIVFTPR